MATAPVSAGSAKIPVRKIGAADLRASLKAGWEISWQCAATSSFSACSIP